MPPQPPTRRHPSTHHAQLPSRPAQTTTLTNPPEDILSTAILVAEAENRRAHRSVLARFTNGFNRISNTLRRRSRRVVPPDPPAKLPVRQPPALSSQRMPRVYACAQIDAPRSSDVSDHTDADPDADPDSPADTDTADDPTPSDDDDRFAIEPLHAGEEQDELVVKSMREVPSCRVRQFGMSDDMDTLLTLPRVASLSFTETDSPSLNTVRRIPRASALLPVRSRPRPRLTPPPSTASSDIPPRAPSSERRVQPLHHVRNVSRPIRLPTGLDVESAIQTAVVEITSDEETELEKTGEAEQGEVADSAPSTSLSNTGSPPPRVAMRSPRVVSDAQFQARPASRDATLRAIRTKRAVSSNDRRRRREDEISDEPGAGGRDFSLFEDDYLSFQGFHGARTDNRPYQSMGSLLRSKRISSVTDSPSEDSDEPTSLVDEFDARRRNGRRVSKNHGGKLRLRLSTS